LFPQQHGEVLAPDVQVDQFEQQPADSMRFIDVVCARPWPSGSATASSGSSRFSLPSGRWSHSAIMSRSASSAITAVGDIAVNQRRHPPVLANG
jgi:hypothetical protein